MSEPGLPPELPLSPLSERRSRILVAALALATVTACAGDRPPAVAGQFYPSDRASLSAMVDQFLRSERGGKADLPLLALVVPHAGYVFSGGVAASGFLRLDPGAEFDDIFLIGASHHVAFEGAAVYTSGDFLTPLGRVPVDRDLARSLLRASPLFLERDDAHRDEHSLEVQLPFLQRRLKKPFRIVPIVLGTQSPEICEKIAEVLITNRLRDVRYGLSNSAIFSQASGDCVHRTIGTIRNGFFRRRCRNGS